MAIKKRRTLLIIDPQRGFCDGKLAELYVPGSEDGIENLSRFIDRNGKYLEDIDLTMDCHHRLHIGHPGFWRDAKGQQPPPFTQIKAQDVADGIWMPKPHGNLNVGGQKMTVAKYAYTYLDALAKGGRYPHTIWPIHCVIGTEGNNIMPRLAKSLWQWEDSQTAACGKHSKGSCYWTEHFGAVRAEVPFPGDPTTELNIGLVRTLQEADEIFVAGWATNFCLANTVRDVATAFGSDDHVKKFTLLTDCTNAVQGYDPPSCAFMDKLTNDFLAELTRRGMKSALAKDAM